MKVDSLPSADNTVPRSRLSWISDRLSKHHVAAATHSEFRIRPAHVLWTLLGILVLIMTANVVVLTAARFLNIPYVQPESKLVNFFDVNHEGNLPTWYQGNALLITGLLLLVVGFSYIRQRPRSHAAYWLLLGAGFCYLSLDEMISMHETIVVPLRRALDIEGGIFYFVWVIPAAIGVLVMLFTFIPFLRSLPKSTSIRFVIAGAIFVGGAVVVEALSGAYLTSRGDESFGYKMITSVEEFLEMLGVVIFIHAILKHLSAVRHPISLHLGEPDGSIARDSASATDATATRQRAS